MIKKNSSKGMHLSISPWLEYMRMNLEKSYLQYIYPSKRARRFIDVAIPGIHNGHEKSTWMFFIYTRTFWMFFIYTASYYSSINASN
jgi:hypothetical protein